MTTKTFNDADLDETCCGCIVGKGHRKAFEHQQRSRRSIENNERIHVDIAGPYPNHGIRGERYHLAI